MNVSAMDPAYMREAAAVQAVFSLHSVTLGALFC